VVFVVVGVGLYFEYCLFVEFVEGVCFDVGGGIV